MRFAVLMLLPLCLLSVSAYADQLSDGKAALYQGNYKTALTLLKPLADQGSVEAEYQLGVLYSESAQNDDMSAGKDYSKSMKMFRKAAGHGNIGAQWRLDELKEIQTMTKAELDNWRKEMRKAAEYGDTEAERMLGSMKPSEEIWWRKAAMKGDPFAQNALGHMYETGTGVKKDYAKAFKWYWRAAEQGTFIHCFARALMAAFWAAVR